MSRKPKQKKQAVLTRQASWQRNSLIIFVLALSLRLVHIAFIQDEPMANNPVGDGESYHLWAQEIAAGNWLGDDVFYAAPFYPYLMGLFYTLFGVKLIWLRVFQSLLGAGACVLLSRTGARFFEEKVGFLAGLLFAIYPVAVYFDGLVQKTSVAFFLFASLLYLVSRLKEHPRFWLGAGLVLGLLAITRENAIVFLPLLLLWLVWSDQSGKIKRAVALTAGLMLIIFPLTLRNKMVADEWVITTSNLGTNFYIGNHHGASGRYEPLRYGRDDWKFERQDALELARQESGRQLGAAEVSGFWLKKTLGELADHPLSWLLLLGKKTLLIINGTEIGDTEDIYTYAGWSPLVGLLLWLFHFGTLFPLAMVGVFLCRNRVRDHLPLYLMLLGYAGSVVLFFVFDRFRFPLSGILVLFAAAALVHLRREFAGMHKLWPAAVFLGALVLANLPLVSKGSFLANSSFNVGKVLARDGNYAEALPHLEAALESMPNRVELRVSYGNALVNLGRFDKAREQLEAAVKLKPDFGEAVSQLALVHLVMGREASAIERYEQALPLLPQDPGCRNNLAWILATSADPALLNGPRALELALEADTLAPENDGYLDTLGAAYARNGDFQQAALVTGRAIELAEAAGKEKEAAQKRARLALYQAGRPFTEAPK